MLEVATRAVTRYSRVSYSGQPTEDMPHRFSCPVWSPDGEYLATVTQEGRTSAVLVYDNRGRLLRFAPVSRQTLFADLVWSPDTDTIYVPQPAARVSAPRIARVPWRQPVAASSLLSLEGWSDIHALAISPDGAYMAFIYLRYGSDEEQKTAVDAGLRIVRLSDMFIMVDKKLYNYDPYKVIGRGRIVWLPGRQVVFAVPQGPGGPNRALLLRYDPAEDTVQTLAMIEDTLYDWALNGSWLVYSTESGVWGAPVDGILDPLTAPYRLSETPVLSFHWRQAVLPVFAVGCDRPGARVIEQHPDQACDAPGDQRVDDHRDDRREFELHRADGRRGDQPGERPQKHVRHPVDDLGKRRRRVRADQLQHHPQADQGQQEAEQQPEHLVHPRDCQALLGRRVVDYPALLVHAGLVDNLYPVFAVRRDGRWNCH